MIPDIVGAVIAALAGAGVAFANYILSRRVLTKKPENYSAVTLVRQIVQISFLVLVYFIGKRAGCDPAYPLIGAVTGITVPMFIFTKKLLSLNEALYGKENRKEDESSG